MITREQMADMAAQIVAGMLARPGEGPPLEYCVTPARLNSPEHYAAASVALVRAIIEELEK